MKKNAVLFLGGLLLLAMGLATGYLFGRADARYLMRRWFPPDSPDANLSTLHVKVRADGTAELRYLPITQRDLKNMVRLRIWDFGPEQGEMCLWSDDAATFGQVTTCALDPVTDAGCWEFELRFVRSTRTYRVKAWLPCPYSDHGIEKPTELRIAADGQVRCGELIQQHSNADAIMSSLQHDGKLGYVTAVIDPACPMGFLFNILASAADHGLTDITLLEAHQGKK